MSAPIQLGEMPSRPRHGLSARFSFALGVIVTAVAFYIFTGG
jgi:hypothetical protein